MTNLAARQAGQRGFALLVVLVAMLLLSAIGIFMLRSGDMDLRVAAGLRASAQAEAVADGLVFEAGFRLLEPDSPWPADGRPFTVRRLGASATLCIVNEAGKINPNLASPGLMRALFHAAGLDTDTAERLAAAVYDWRMAGAVGAPPGARSGGRRLATIAQLGLVPGVPPGLVARLRPYLTVLTDDQPDPRAAPPFVLAALQELVGGIDPVTMTDPGPPRTVTVFVDAVTADGGRFKRQAALRLGHSGEPLVTILTWSQTEREQCADTPNAPRAAAAGRGEHHL